MLLTVSSELQEMLGASMDQLDELLGYNLPDYQKQFQLACIGMAHIGDSLETIYDLQNLEGKEEVITALTQANIKVYDYVSQCLDTLVDAILQHNAQPQVGCN